MTNKMKIDKKILSEIERYNKINRYILEQDLGAVPPPPADAGAVPPPPADAGAVPPPPADAGAVPPPAEPIDVNADDEVEKIDDAGDSEEGGDSNTEELDVTDLVDSQKTIETKQEEYFNNLFQQLTNLESKLSEMDSIVGRLNAIENKIEKYREKTPEEKLELRSYDSYPFNQKLSDFFDDKKVEMEKTGKHDYILTTDDVTDVTPNEIKDTFLPKPDNSQF